MIRTILCFISLMFISVSAHSIEDFIKKRISQEARVVPSSGVELVEFQPEELELFVKPGNASTGLPSRLYGIWWLDGVNTGSRMVTFGEYKWRNDGSEKIDVKTAGSGWIWDASDGLEGNYDFSYFSNLTYKFDFSDDITSAKIDIRMKIYGVTIKFPRWAVNATMRRVNEELWVRETCSFFCWFPVSGGNYDVRRVVDGNGKRTSQFGDFVESMNDLGVNLAVVAD